MASIVLALLAMIGLSFSFSFTIPSSQLAYKNSTLAGVDEISAQQLYAEITPAGTWHYYATKSVAEVKAAPAFSPLGFSSKGSNIITVSVSFKNITEYRNETVCSKPSMASCLDPRNRAPCRARPMNCSVALRSMTTEMATFTEDSKGDVALLAVESNNWESGSFNPSVSACGALTTANAVYTLNASVSINNSTCFTVSAANVTLNCNGYGINGNLAPVNPPNTNTYGIYSNQSGTIVKNCNISQFTRAVYFNGVANGAINNTTASTTATTNPAGYGFYLYGSSYNRISSSFASAPYLGGIALSTGSDSNTITNSTGYGDIRDAGNSGPGIFIEASSNNTIINSTGITSGNYTDSVTQAGGIYLDASHNNTIINSTGITRGWYGHGVVILGSNRNIVTNVAGIASPAGYTGIAVYGGANNTFTNVTGNASSGIGISLDVYSGPGIYSTNNTFINSTGTSSDGYGIYLSLSSNNRFTNCVGFATGTNVSLSVGIMLGTGAEGNAFANFSASCNRYSGLYLYGGNNNTFTGGQIRGIYGPYEYGALFLYGASTSSNTIANSTINGMADNYPVHLLSAGSGNYLVNNTILNASNLFCAEGGSGANTFYWNNFTSIGNPTLYINDTTGSNSYSAIVNGSREGNIYANIMSGNPAAYGPYHSFGFPSLYIGASGAVPYNAASSLGKISGSAVDPAPLTPGYLPPCICGNLSVAGATCMLFFDLYSNSTCLNVQAQNVTINGNGFGIIGNNTTGTYGIYTSQFNTTIKNVAISNFANALGLAGATGALVRNNTFIPDAGKTRTLVTLNASASSNTFYWNNFTNTSGYYVQDLNGSNTYNTTVAGRGEGNIYANVLAGGVLVYGLANSSIPGLYVGTSGAVPYTQASSGGKMSGTIYDYAPLTPFSECACGAISTPNYVCTLIRNQSINGSTCFTISAPNVTINCNGSSITGNSTNATAGVSSSQAGTTVRNCQISNFAYGIRLAGSGPVVADNNISSTAAYASPGGTMGIFLVGATNGTFSRNRVNVSGNPATWDAAIRLEDSSQGNAFSNSTLEGGSTAIVVIENSSSNSFTNTSAKGVLGAIVVGPYNFTVGGHNYLGYSDNLAFTKLTIPGSSNGTAIDNGGSNSMLVDCQGGSISGSNASDTYGVYSSRQNTTVRNCSISNFATGIGFNGADNGTISNATLSASCSSGSCALGISLYNHANYNNISGITVSGYTTGISLDSSDSNTFTSVNSSASTYYGIHLKNTSSGNLVANSYGSGQIGIYLSDASLNQITGSTGYTSQASGAGIKIMSSSSCAGASANTVTNSAGTSTLNSPGIALDTSCFNSIASSNGTSGSYAGILITSGSWSNSVTGSIGTSNSSNGIQLFSSMNNTLTNSTGASTSSSAILVQSNSSNNRFVGTTTVTGTGANSTAYSIIGGSNVSIDCQGKSLSGTNTSGTYGVYTSQYNTTVANCAIRNFSTGLNFTGASYGTVENTSSSTTGSGGYGAYLEGADHNRIISSNLSSSAAEALYIYLSNYTNASGGAYSAALDGVGIYNATGNSISNITIASGRYGIYLPASSSGTTAASNVVSPALHAIFLDQSSRNNISSNAITKADSNDTFYGIYLLSSANNSVSGNVITVAAGKAIYLHSESAPGNNSVSGNVVTAGNGTGIAIEGTNTNFFSHNHATSGGYGIFLGDGTNNSFVAD
ncbi:MAG: NosD domain-containing protein, partial [Candidatus Micrarchaeia archaeon]